MAIGFEFNKVYVIESLNDSLKTGEELYNDILRWKDVQIPELNCYLFQPVSRGDFIQCLAEIQKDVDENGSIPILHIEAHGNMQGLLLKSGEFVFWSELYNSFVKINESTRCNLFLTLAICQGAYLIYEIKSNRPAPFWGFIGSFEKIMNGDILIRYTEFYSEFLTSFDLNKAYERLIKANPAVPKEYRLINSEITFRNVYGKYVDTQFSEKTIKNRFESTMKEINKTYRDRNEKNKAFLNFKSNLLRTKYDFFNSHRDIFFMVDKFPENVERFNLTDWKPFG